MSSLLNLTLRLFTVFGIPLELHISFSIVVLHFAEMGWRDFRWIGVYWGVITCAMLFTFVVMHELGHALAARRFGIQTRKILLLPIGGIAFFERMPETAMREIVVTLAGPAVNFAMVALLYPFSSEIGIQGSFAINDQQLVNFALLFNLWMGLFNLIPVFPMDGGRLLRAALSFRLGYRRATAITANAGTALACVGAAVALLEWRTYYLLAALFLFIAYMSRAEVRELDPDEPGPSEEERN